MSKRVQHTSTFKAEAIHLVETSEKSVTQIAHDLGISARTLYHWLEEAEASAESPSLAYPATKGAEASEIKRLQRELETVRQERDILKKAISVFSRDPS